jgi:hypothetical protein
MKQTRHTILTTVRKHIREAELFIDNAVEGIVLTRADRPPWAAHRAAAGQRRRGCPLASRSRSNSTKTRASGVSRRSSSAKQRSLMRYAENLRQRALDARERGS